MTALLTATPAAFTTATVDVVALLPLLIVFGGALLGVLVEAFVPRASRFQTQVVLTVVVLVGALVALAVGAVNHRGTTAGTAGSDGILRGAVVIDGPALFIQSIILLFALLAVFTYAERLGGVGSDTFTPMGAAVPGSAREAEALRAGAMTAEVFPLFLFSVAGMMLFPAAGDLLTMFVALEVLSLPLYIMCGLSRRRRLLSQEASLKYFLLGAFSSAFFLFGVALLYGYAGSVYLPAIAAAISSPVAGLGGLLVPGILLIAVGLLFKVGAVPFHMWTPDVYQGAPTPVTGFMAAGTKAAAFGAILRFFYVGVDQAVWDWRPVLMVIAALTMVVGAVLSVTQTDMKRLLAYSSIAHAGFVLLGVTAVSRDGISGTLFYVLAYGLTSLAAFGIIALVRENGSEATHLSQWAGLGKRHPWTAGVYAFLLLAFAGIPLTSGFTAKFAVFAPMLALHTAGSTALVVLALLCSAITVFVYARIIVLMYFTEPTHDDVAVVDASGGTIATIAVGSVLTLVLGVAPAFVLNLAAQASQFIR